MNHWFDDLTKQLAADTLSRRSVLAAATATLAAVATGTGWPRLLSAAALKTAAAQPNGYKGPRPAAAAFTHGPCKVTSTGAALKHELTSTANAGGKTAVLHATRAFDLKGMTSNKTVLLNGKQQFQITHVSTAASKSTRLTIGDAFGFKGAQLTSADGGKTLKGTVDGRAILPYVQGSGKKAQFADGKPWTAKETPGARDAVKAAFTKHSEDRKLCSSQLNTGTRSDAQAGPGQRPAPAPKQAAPGYAEYPGEGGMPISSVNTNAYLRPKCIACGNACDPGVLQAANDTLSCILGIFELDFSACGALINLTSQQETCFEGCNALPACLGQLCLKTRPNTAVAIIPTCTEGDICLKEAPGYCCPHGYPNLCPGGFSTDCPSFEAGCPPEDYNNICCPQDSVCLQDSSPALSENAKGGWINLCCPKDRICGTKVANAAPAAAWKQIGTVYQGTCCPPGMVCAKSMLAGAAGNSECCEPKNIRHGNCCNGKWCGEQCCPGQNAKCDGNKCAELCLNGYTTDGKCCPSGVACGKVCCSSSCADIATSTCGAGNSHVTPK
jgi:hypothetical protein